MNVEPPSDSARPDPTAYTQPMRVVQPQSKVEPIAVAPATAVTSVYAPTFGNLGTYAFTRFAALVIDYIVVTFVLACFAFNLADRGVLAFAPKSAAGFATIAGIAFCAALVLALIFESIFETTLGKAFFGLGVRRGTGGHAGLHRIVIRYVLLPIDLIVIGELLALVTRRHQRLGDFAAGTVVARHRIGGFATALAIVLFAGLIYAQLTFGGGLTSALAVTAEGSFFGPSIARSILGDLGLGRHLDSSGVVPFASASANAQNDATPSDAPASPTPQ